MSKVTGKFQITLPKRLVDAYGINIGDEVELRPAGDCISLVPARSAKKTDMSNPRQRLAHFDRATERQRKREQTRTPGSSKNRGWTREELYTRGQPR